MNESFRVSYLLEPYALAGGCAHPQATFTVGPTTDQRNWSCAACRSTWTTCPTDEERRRIFQDHK